MSRPSRTMRTACCKPGACTVPDVCAAARKPIAIQTIQQRIVSSTRSKSAASAYVTGPGKRRRRLDVDEDVIALDSHRVRRQRHNRRRLQHLAVSHVELCAVTRTDDAAFLELPLIQ